MRTLVTLGLFLGILNHLKGQDIPKSDSLNTQNSDSVKTQISTAIPDSTLEQPVSETEALKPVTNKAESEGFTGRFLRAFKKANRLYDEKAFGDAIEYYTRARKQIESEPELLSKLGDCYRFTKNNKGQLDCYGTLCQNGNAQPIQELYYAHALMESGSTEQARDFFSKYQNDERGKRMLKAIEKAESYKRNESEYQVSSSKFNSVQNDIGAVKYRDEVVFVSNRNPSPWVNRQSSWNSGGYFNIYKTNASGQQKPVKWGGAMSSKYHDGPISFNSNYSMAYITRNGNYNEDAVDKKIYKLKIIEASLTGDGKETELGFNKPDYDFCHPSISANDSVLYFASNMPGGFGGMDIYKVKRDEFGFWGQPENMGEKINTPGNEIFPFAAKSGALYFSSDGQDGLGGLDIYIAKLKEDRITSVYNVGTPINTKDDDFAFYLDETGKSGYLSSNRKHGGMDDDIFEVKITGDPRYGKPATLIMVDKKDNHKLDSVEVVINGETLYSDTAGKVSVILEEEPDYGLLLSRSLYLPEQDSIHPKTISDEQFVKTYTLELDPKLAINGRVIDSKTGQSLDDVRIRITDILTNAEVQTHYTKSDGAYYQTFKGKRLNQKLVYFLRIDKPGYLQHTQILDTIPVNPGDMALETKLIKVELGMDLGKMANLNPIYFDQGKSKIRPDAAIELDKIVSILKDMPQITIELRAHTDCRAAAASNLSLSQSRASASMNYIIKKGIDKRRLKAKGFGETKLLNACACEGKTKDTCPESEHAKNRRTEFIVTKIKPAIITPAPGKKP